MIRKEPEPANWGATLGALAVIVLAFFVWLIIAFVTAVMVQFGAQALGLDDVDSRRPQDTADAFPIGFVLGLALGGAVVLLVTLRILRGLFETERDDPWQLDNGHEGDGG